MSFIITVSVRAGRVEASVAGECPDGAWQVAGSDDDGLVSLSVVQADLAGRYRQQASSTYSREQ